VELLEDQERWHVETSSIPATASYLASDFSALPASCNARRNKEHIKNPDGVVKFN